MTELFLEPAISRQWTFDEPIVKQRVEENCNGLVLNLFAGKNRLNCKEYRVDVSEEFSPDFLGDAEKFVHVCIDNNIKFDTIIYDPPWNERKARELYNGKYIGKFTRYKEDIVRILNPNGRILTLGYKITNWGKKRGFEIEKVYIFNPSGDINPFFLSVEKLK